MKAARAVAGSLLLLAALPGQAQLPAPARTVYKCDVDGKVAYADAPCLGARRLDVAPGRGIDTLSGTKRTGADVAREARQEQMARALRPLTGMNEQEYATAARRHRLGASARRECRTLEAAILDNEQAEQRRAGRGVMEALQQDTLSLRKRYRELGC